MKKELDKSQIKKLYKSKNEIEAKLTEAEIVFNKIDFKNKEYKQEIKSLEKEIFSSTKAGLVPFNEDKKRIENLIKAENKIITQTNKKETDPKLKKNILNGAKLKLKDLNKQLKLANEKIEKYKNLNVDSIQKQIDKVQLKIDAIKPERKEKKDIVKAISTEYDAILAEWKEAMPEIDENISLSVRDLNIWYGSKQSLFNVNIDFPKNEVIAIIGPSGCGKSTFLKTLNRINDEIPIFNAEGELLLDNEIDILKLRNKYNPDEKITLPELRTKVGMVFQQPNPFPMSIFNNVAYGPKINGIKNKAVLNEIVIDSLKKAAIYEQVKDNLDGLATGLSGGQQQRLCIARAIANQPEILLMDEPTSALDPIGAAKIEDLILELKKYYTIIMVTHSMQQASRISDKTAFFYQGKLIEYGDTKQIFTNPKHKRTEDYIRGRFG